jgi:hypothetical protein
MGLTRNLGGGKRIFFGGCKKFGGVREIWKGGEKQFLLFMHHT